MKKFFKKCSENIEEVLMLFLFILLVVPIGVIFWALVIEELLTIF